MADTTELKTYVIKVESNLNKYAEDAVKAEKAVDDLAVANKKLKGSGTTPEEMKIANAELKVRNDEYKKAEALLKNAVAVVKAETGSRKQLELAIRLGRQELGKMPEMYIKEANSLITIINPAYTTHIQKLAALTNMQIKYDQTINDGRSNVGRYSESLKGALGSISAMPGPLGRAAAGAENFAATFAKIGPIGALIGGALLAISAPLVAFFKSSEEGIELLERKVTGFKASINVLKGDLISLGKSMVGEQGDEAAPWGSRLVKGLRMIVTTANLIPGVSKYFDDLAKRMNEAGAAAEKYTLIQQQLEDAERALIVPRAEANLKIKEARLLYADETKSLEVRIGALQTALDLENKTADEEVKHQQFKILNLRDQNEEKRKAGQLLDEDDKRMQEAIAREIELRTESVGRQVRAANTLKSARAELLKEESDGIKKIAEEKNKALENESRKVQAEYEWRKDLLAAELKMKAQFYKEWRDLVEKEAAGSQIIFEEELRKLLGVTPESLGIQRINPKTAEIAKSTAKQGDKDDAAARAKTLTGWYATENAKKEITIAAYDAMSIASDSAFEVAANNRNKLMQLELSNSNLTEKQKLAIQKKYYKQEQNMSVVQTIINGVVSIAKTFANMGWPAGLVGAAISAAATIAQIALIKSQSFDGGGSGSPSAISGSVPAQKTFAQSAGSSVLTQTQLSQPQLNAIPNQNTLTAADIAAALSGMPPPIVTVEDINAKVKAVNKVEVRANI